MCLPEDNLLTLRYWTDNSSVSQLLAVVQRDPDEMWPAEDHEVSDLSNHAGVPEGAPQLVQVGDLTPVPGLV